MIDGWIYLSKFRPLNDGYIGGVNLSVVWWTDTRLTDTVKLVIYVSNDFGFCYNFQYLHVNSIFVIRFILFRFVNLCRGAEICIHVRFELDVLHADRWKTAIRQAISLSLSAFLKNCQNLCIQYMLQQFDANTKGKTWTIRSSMAQYDV